MPLDNKVLDKYYKDYICGVNVDNIEFKKFNYAELQNFFREYYYDNELNQVVYWEVSRG